MAMNPAALKAKMKLTIYNGLKAQFAGEAGKGAEYTPISDAQWMKIAEAISGISADIILEVTKATVSTPEGPGKLS